jgi:hypothetical protein
MDGNLKAKQPQEKSVPVEKDTESISLINQAHEYSK